MLVACRLAGLSALEAYYAEVRARAQCGGGPLGARPDRGRISPFEARGLHPTGDPGLAVLAAERASYSGFPSEPSPTDQRRGIVEQPSRGRTHVRHAPASQFDPAPRRLRRTGAPSAARRARRRWAAPTKQRLSYSRWHDSVLQRFREVKHQRLERLGYDTIKAINAIAEARSRFKSESWERKSEASLRK
jgi:hypothetical protein